MISTAVLVFLAGSSFGHAHHGYSIEFDSKAPVLIKGKVTKVELINPHSWIHIRVEEKGKPAVNWMVEGGTPNTLLRSGVTRDTLKVGTVISARGYQAHDRSCKPACRASGRDLTFPDGTKIFVKGSGFDEKAEEAPAGKK